MKMRQSAALAEGARLNNGGIQARGIQGGSHSVITRKSRDTAGGAAPGVRASKSSEFREGE